MEFFEASPLVFFEFPVDTHSDGRVSSTGCKWTRNGVCGGQWFAVGLALSVLRGL